MNPFEALGLKPELIRLLPTWDLQIPPYPGKKPYPCWLPEPRILSDWLKQVPARRRFRLPLLHLIEAHNKCPQALIVCPPANYASRSQPISRILQTHEIQCAEAVVRRRIHHHADPKPEKGVHIVVATPEGWSTWSNAKRSISSVSAMLCSTRPMKCWIWASAMISTLCWKHHKPRQYLAVQRHHAAGSQGHFT